MFSDGGARRQEPAVTKLVLLHSIGEDAILAPERWVGAVDFAWSIPLFDFLEFGENDICTSFWRRKVLIPVEGTWLSAKEFIFEKIIASMVLLVLVGVI